MKPTEATAYEMGRECRVAGHCISSNSFSDIAWHNVVRNIGRKMAPKYDEWMHWQAIWSKGWLDMDHDLRFPEGGES